MKKTTARMMTDKTAAPINKLPFFLIFLKKKKKFKKIWLYS